MFLACGGFHAPGDGGWSTARRRRGSVGRATDDEIRTRPPERLCPVCSAQIDRISPDSFAVRLLQAPDLMMCVSWSLIGSWCRLGAIESVDAPMCRIGTCPRIVAWSVGSTRLPSGLAQDFNRCLTTRVRHEVRPAWCGNPEVGDVKYFQPKTPPMLELR